jgi:hypothetical protein
MKPICYDSYMVVFDKLCGELQSHWQREVHHEEKFRQRKKAQYKTMLVTSEHYEKILSMETA